VSQSHFGGHAGQRLGKRALATSSDLHEKLTGKAALVNLNDEEQLELDMPEPDLPEL
jgi:hypothetical protein